MKASAPTNRHSAPALFKGLSLLEEVVKAGSLSFSQMEALPDMNTSTLNRLIKELLSLGYLRKDGDGRYRGGIRLVSLAKGVPLADEMVRLASPFLVELCQRFKVTAALFLYEGTGIRLVEKEEHPHNTALRARGEMKQDFLYSPWGYIYLALGRADEVKRLESLDLALAHLPLPSAEYLEGRKEQVVSRGYSDDEGCVLKGIRRVGVPLYIGKGDLIGCLGTGWINSDDINVVTMVEAMKTMAAAVGHHVEL